MRRKKPGLTKAQKQAMKDHNDGLSKIKLFNKPLKSTMVRTTTKKVQPKTIQEILAAERNAKLNIKHSNIHDNPTVAKPKTRYDGELLERELLAQQEIERKKKRVGITFNKGAYQYLGDDIDPTTLGK